MMGFETPRPRERLLESTVLPSGGVYTSVGTYDAAEMVELVSNLSTMTGVPVADLLQDFGRHLFRQFVEKFPHFFAGITSSFEFLGLVDSYVHVEVRKLYADAELPSFTCERPAPGHFVMTYRSTRNLPDLAEGLIRECIRHFGEQIDIRREVVVGESGAVRFDLFAT
jgi:hypothetical protein